MRWEVEEGGGGCKTTNSVTERCLRALESGEGSGAVDQAQMSSVCCLRACQAPGNVKRARASLFACGRGVLRAGERRTSLFACAEGSWEQTNVK